MAGVTTLAPAGTREVARASRGWLFGPVLDSLLVANLVWPLFLVAQWGEGFSGRDGVQFWQLYYITTPHRWITLVLVFLDRERFSQRRWAFVGVGALVVVGCLGVQLTTGTLTCLLAIDYVWNAWHFAAQHHGIYRIYERLADPARTRGLVVEKWAMRLFLLYVILRVAIVTWSDTGWGRGVQSLDWAMAVVPLGLIARDLSRGRSGAIGGTTYLLSVSVLYLSLLAAVHWIQPGLVLALATASALFHAIEYLSLVTWSVHKRHVDGRQSGGVLAYLAPRWVIALAMFMLILGISGWLLDQHLLKTWLLINVVVAFLHYAYDGMIWRSRTSK